MTQTTQASRAVRTALACTLLVAMLLATGCAPLVQVKPLDGSLSAEPLPPGELLMRFEVRTWSSGFADRIEVAADRIAAATRDPSLRAAALRWKLGASAAAVRAGLRQPGQLALVDTWALARQSLLLVDGGPAGDAFGAQQPMAIETARALAEEADAMAARLLQPAALAAYRTLVDTHVARHPITDLGFGRAPIALEWLGVAQRVDGIPKTVGAASEVLSDATDRSDAYARRTPDWLRWQAELALRDSAATVDGFGRAVASIDRELASIGQLAREQPDRAQRALERLRGDVSDVLAAADRRWMDALGALRAERVAIARSIADSQVLLDATIERERAALAGAFDAQRALLTESFDAQRAALTADGERIAADLSRLWLDRAQSMLRDVLLWLGLFLVGIAAAGFGLGWAGARAVGARRARAGPGGHGARSDRAAADDA